MHVEVCFNGEMLVSGLEKLRISQFNLENFFVYMDYPLLTSLDQMTESEWQKHSISNFENKSLLNIRAIAKCIRDINADVYALCEVGGIESIQNFAKNFLADEYRAFSIEGNSDRGIDLAYLVKANLAFQIDLRTHKDRSIDFIYPHEKQSVQGGYLDPKYQLKFSRDVLELRLFKNSSEEPSLIVLNVHLKSQLDKDNIDPQGKDRRKAELEKLLEIYNEIYVGLNEKVPIVVAGDFNGIASQYGTDPEFLSLRKKTTLQDVFDLAEIPQEQRVTQLQFAPSGKCWRKQFDYIFVSPNLQKHVIASETFVYRFKDELGSEMSLPSTLNEKRKLASDHYPVVTTLSTIDMTKLTS